MPLSTFSTVHGIDVEIYLDKLHASKFQVKWSNAIKVLCFPSTAFKRTALQPLKVVKPFFDTSLSSIRRGIAIQFCVVDSGFRHCLCLPLIMYVTLVCITQYRMGKLLLYCVMNISGRYGLSQKPDSTT